MPSCAFTRCKNSSRTKNKCQGGISFHSFPQDEMWRHKWQQVIRRQRREPDWQPTNNSRVCSMHFKPEDKYTTDKGYMKILKCAVPYYRSEYSPIIQIIKTESLDTPSTSSAGPSSSKVPGSPEFYEVPLETPRCATPSGLSDIGSSDLEGALDTPTVLSLRKQLREKDEEFKERLMKKDEEIELLKKANKRLNQKNITLRQLLAKMRKKLLLLKRKTNKTKAESDDEDEELSNNS